MIVPMKKVSLIIRENKKDETGIKSDLTDEFWTKG